MRKKRIPDQIKIPRDMYESIKRIAWECSFASRIRRVPLEEIVLSAYISGLQHGVAATERLIEEESMEKESGE